MGCIQSNPNDLHQPSTANGINTDTDDLPGKSHRPKVVVAGPAPEASDKISDKVALGAGCFWGVEKFVVQDFQKKFPKSIKSATVGFMSPMDNPRIKNPNYNQICGGQSDHVEVLFVELYDPKNLFEELIRFFFSFHDPTLKNRQGNDRGFQYSSWIFCGDEEQFQIALKVRNELQEAMQQKIVKVFATKQVETQLCGLKGFTPAEEAHQGYLFKHPGGYCNHRIRLREWYNIQGQYIDNSSDARV